MGYQVLARKYRPQKFADVAGQDHVTRTLINALTLGRIAHGYIFSGHRGIGKTTIARILAMALDCRTAVGTAERPTVEPCLQCFSCREIASGGNAQGDVLASNSFDFIEIDAASNRGIDDVRSICSQADVRPARDKYKIFLLDEAHQITDAAFNAILKTLEEPPEWAIFMMATTEPENIPQTIRSRCQHFSFHAVKFEDILGQLRAVAEKESVSADEEALALLAEAGDGSMRDALSIMDQAIASAPLQDGRAVLQAQQIRELMGAVPNAVFERLMEAVSAQQPAVLMEDLDRLISSGNSPASLARQLVRYLRNALMAKLGGEKTQLLAISQDERARAWRTAQLFTEDELTRNLQIALRTFDELNEFQEHRFHLEIGMLKLIQAQKLLPVEELLSGLNSSAPGSIVSGSIASGPPSRPSSGGSAPVRASAAPALADRPASAARVAPQASAASASAPSLSPFASSASGAISATHTEASAIRVTHDATTITHELPALREPLASVVAAVPGITAAALTLAPEPLTSGALALAEPELVAHPQAVSGSAAVERKISTPQQISATQPGPQIVPSLAASVDTMALPEEEAGSAPGEAGEVSAAASDTSASGAVAGDGLEAARNAVLEALTNGGHSTAATLLDSGQWTLDGASVKIAVPIKATMIRLTFNAAAEKLIRQGLTQAGAPSRFLIVPGEGAVAPGGQRTARAPQGSIDHEARTNPLVLEAQTLFQAEIIAVVDLRS